jgi:phasin family protein
MENEVKGIASAADAAPIVQAPIAQAPLAPDSLSDAALAVPEAEAAMPVEKIKGKPGRPRKVAAATVAVKPEAALKAAVIAEPVAAENLPVVKAAEAPKAAKPALRKAAKTPSKSAEVVTKSPAPTPKPITAFPRSAAPKQKDTFIMTTTTTEMTETIQTAMKDAAEKAKATLEKTQAAMGDMGAFTKGNMEAVVESSKILATGLQEMGKSYVAESKSVVETMTAEIKDLASVKSPAEFFEKQNAMLRKQFDAAVAASSKSSEAMLKLASEAFQPISNRVSLAVEKIKHAA